MTTRTFNFGTVEVEGYIGYHTVKVDVTLKEENDKPVFTASATCGNIMGGQCIDEIWEECQDQLRYKDYNLYKEIMELWQKYHLNDTKAWCEHQNYGDDMQEKVTVYHLRGNKEYDRLSKVRELPERYLEVTEEGLKNVPMALYEPSTLYSKDGKEQKSTGWITYDELYAPEGLLGRECPECGAKYGHSWYYMPIPENDLNRIKQLLNLA